MEWTKATQKFTVGPRFAHASCVVNAKIFVFGGQKKGYLDDLWTWDTAAEEWVSYTVNGQVPPPRVQHTLVFTGQQALLFAGYCENIAEVNDLHALDVLQPESEFTWSQPEVQGEPPPKRYGHSATMVGERMIVVAGQDSHHQLADVWSLHCPTYAWSAVDCSGAPFIPRTLHTTSFVLGKGLITLGGFNRKIRNLREVMCLDLAADAASGTWRKLQVMDDDDAFKGRSQHRVVQQSRHIIIFGGFDGEKTLNDMVVFDTDSDTFLTPPPPRNAPEPRSRHTLELVGSDVYCFLGFKGDWACGPDVCSLRIGNSEEPLSRIMTASE